MKFIGVVVVLAILDVITTTIGLNNGAMELNPMMRYMVESPWGMLFKVVFTAVVALALVLKKKEYIDIGNHVDDEGLVKVNRWIKIINITKVLAVILMVVVPIWNTIVIITLL